MNKHHRVWSLQEAKAKFSEVVRLAQTEGPQVVTVHGRVAVEIIAAGAAGAEKETGAALVDLLNRSPLRNAGNLKFERPRLKVRGRKPVL